MSYLPTDSRLENTDVPAVSRPNSSGENSKADVFDDLNPEDSASALGNASLSLLGHLVHIFSKLQKTIITVTFKCKYATRTETFDISTYTTWGRLLNRIDTSPKLAIPIITREIYHLLPDGRPAYVSELSALEHGKEYFVETDLHKPTLKEMEEFFGKLQTERNRPESDIEKVREVFSEQGILFQDLMAQGEFALTDGELEKIGITESGLRTSILALVKKYPIV